MKLLKFFVFSANLSVAASAAAGVTVIGSSSARICYEAAEKDSAPTLQDLRHCDEALLTGALSAYEQVATHVNRGILRYKKGDIAASLKDFDRAIALDPNQPEAYLNKAAALYRDGQTRAALPLFSVALEKKTRRPELAYYGRAVAHEDLGNVALAYHDYRRAIEANPHWAAPRAELARFLVRRK